MVRIISLCLIISCLFSCKNHRNSVYSTEIPFLPGVQVFLQISDERYLLSSTDGEISSGILKKKNGHLFFEDKLSQESFLIEKKDQFIIFRNGRYKDLFFAKDNRIMKSYGFNETADFRFEVDNDDLRNYLKHMSGNQNMGKSQIKLLNSRYSNFDDLLFEVYSTGRFAYLYKGLIIEYGTFYKEQDTLVLGGESYMEQRKDNNEKQRSIIMASKNPHFKVFIINDSTLSLGTLPFARINHLVTFKDTVHLPLIRESGFLD